MRTTFLSLILLTLSLSVFSQYNVQPYDSQDAFGPIGTQECIVVKIYDRPADKVISDWKRLMKKKHDAKVEVTGMETFADNAEIESVSDNTMDVYSKVVMTTNGYLEFKVAVNLGGAYLTRAGHPSKHAAMSVFVGQFALKQTQEGITIAIEKEEDVLKDLQKEKTKFNKNIESAKKKITGYEKDIAEQKEVIKTNEQSIVTQDKKIEEQSKLIAELQAIKVQK